MRLLFCCVRRGEEGVHVHDSCAAQRRPAGQQVQCIDQLLIHVHPAGNAVQSKQEASQAV
jgi:hypothetical protein